jgi:hypothetical protein
VSPTSPHIYSPLRSDTTIRLISLHPARDAAAPLRCSLCQYDTAEELPEYEALSYAWGVHEFNETLYCNNIIVDGNRESHVSSSPTASGHVEFESAFIKITASLHAALRVLRQRSGTRTLWVDAIVRMVSFICNSA